MIIRKTFEEWLQQFDSRLHIEPVTNEVVNEKGESQGRKENPDVEVLYHGGKRLCSVPKGSRDSKGWTDVVNDKRYDSGYETSDNIEHRSLSGVGLILLSREIIDAKEFVNHFLTKRNRKVIESLQKRGIFPRVSG